MLAGKSSASQADRLCRYMIAISVVSSFVVFALQPSQAQRAGTRIGRDANKNDGITALRMIAECYYDRSPKSVRTWLDMVPGQDGERELLKRDVDTLSPCLDSDRVVFDGKKVGFQPRSLRGPLGAVMARRLLLQSPNPTAPASGSTPWFYERLAKMPPEAPRDAGSLASMEFGHCVASERWTSSLALIRSVDGSPEEKAAVADLVPVLNGCLPSGIEIKITKRNLRDMIGEPVYHLLLAGPQGEKR